ncbi:MAG: tetratricopeptide repeat protein [Betaproteobacteria bacterium]|nr:tetratricopeptide repeat protein [Betaproteobacteria bacterium]
MTADDAVFQPRDAADVFGEAVALQEAGRHVEAIATLRRVVALEPSHAEAHTRLGWLLCRSGKIDEAVSCHLRATQLVPGFAAAWSNLGVALQARGDHDEALRVLQHAVTLDPGLPHSHVNLGLEWQARGMAAQAAVCHRHAIALDPSMVEAWINLALALQQSLGPESALAATRKALRIAPSHPAALSNLQMALQYSAQSCAADLRREALAAGSRLGQGMPLPQREPFAPGSRRLRIGYVSADFWSHPVGWMGSPAILAHDRTGFEVHCFADGTMDDAVTQRLRAGVEHWHTVAGMDDEALRGLVLSLGIDVLVDMAGHTAGNRLGVFARRAAPVQLSWLGFAASTGVGAVDGVVLGSDLAPEGSEAAFTERIRRLGRRHLTYAPPDYAPPVAAPPSARPGAVAFGCFNNVAKIGDGVLRAWALILHALPESRLVLKSRSLGDPEVAAIAKNRLAALGIDSPRVETRGGSPHPEMLAEYGGIDIALDPFPFCGGLTTCEALWMGVPVVTLPWRRPMSRQGLSVLRAVGLEDLAAGTPKHYVAAAVALASDGPRRAELRASLRERMRRSALFDAASLARALECEYLRAASGERS